MANRNPVSQDVRAAKVAAGRRLLNAANARGMTMTELAALTGASPAALGRWAEGGMPLASVPDLEHAARVCKVGGIMPRLGRASKTDRVLSPLDAQKPLGPIFAEPTPSPAPVAKASTGDLGDAVTALGLLLEAIPTPMLWAELTRRNGGGK